MSTIERDRALIDALGGAAKVAALLNIDPSGGVQRVHNWKSRGIPAAVKVARPDLFMRDDLARATAASETSPV